MKQRHLLLSITLFAFLFLFSIVSLSVFAVTPNLELTPASQSVTVGSQATIEVVVEDVTDLKGAYIILEFDASKLQYISSAAGSFIPNSFLFEQNINNINGSISLAIIAALGDNNYASGSGTIMTVIFERIASGNTNITFGTTELKDKDNNIIAHTTGSGCSFVACLGDFGSVGGGPPDGYVDFEDLMIFSMAYGSTPSDSNWNPSCDIAGPGGTLTPDGVIDFEDLMIFAIHYGDICGECTLPAAPILSDPGSSLTSPATYTVDWNEVSGAASYVLQESTSSGFSEVQEYNVGDTIKNFSHTVSSTTTYYYRVAAVNSCGQSGWSNVENIEIKIEGIPSGGAKWTIIVYMDGDNDLDSYAWDDLSELESVSSTDEIKIVTQLDAYYSCNGTFRYYITGAAPGASYPLYPDDIVQTLSEQNMADPATLTSFVNWAAANYPAEKYLLVLWDHGAGWRDRNILTKGVIWDDTSGDFMTMAELVQGLNGVNEGIDIIGFDACLMQMAEVAYEMNGLTNLPNYMVASQASEWGDGWPYDDILAHLLANPGMAGGTLCETIVNDFINYCGSEGTLSVLDFSAGTYDTYTALNSFALALMASSYQDEIATARSSAQSYSYGSGYRIKDLYDFAERIKNSVPDCQSEAQTVMDQVNDLVLFEAHTGSGVANSHGLSIYLPDSASEYDDDYDDLQFAIDTQWDEFLKSSGVVPPSSVYRGFLVGVGDYQYFPDAYGNTDLPAPPFDVDRMHDTLNHSGSGFSLINELIDLQATKSAILNGIATAFSGADSDDVSYFYFSGHGMNYSGVSYLCPTNVSYYSPLSSFISTNELEAALSAIPGTKVVILDCCHSGGFIGKQMQEEKIISNAREFNDNVINSFLSRDLTGSQYKVLTSCLSTQVCVELIPGEGDPFGLFSGVLCEGCGYNYYTHPYFADGNGNGEITLHEAYTYTDEQVTIIATALNDLYGWNIDQDTQVYPLYSDFVIIEE